MATNNSNRGVKSTTPPRGQAPFRGFALTEVGDLSYPLDGYGDLTTVAGSAIWGDLVAGTFEVVVESIYLPSGTTSIGITELGGNDEAVAMLSNSADNDWYENVNVVFRDGFKFTTANGGALLTFRIVKYYE